jgi:hypothetical protein
MPVLIFTCSICGETSEEICVYCTKDTCANHLCERCHRCSDCCVCETPIIREKQVEAAPVPEPAPEQQPDMDIDQEPVLEETTA